MLLYLYFYKEENKRMRGVSTNTAGRERSCTHSITVLYAQCKATTFSLQNRKCFSKEVLERKRQATLREKKNQSRK